MRDALFPAAVCTAETLLFNESLVKEKFYHELETFSGV